MRGKSTNERTHACHDDDAWEGGQDVAWQQTSRQEMACLLFGVDDADVLWSSSALKFPFLWLLSFEPVGDFVIFCCLARMVSKCCCLLRAASLSRFSKLCFPWLPSMRLMKATSAT